MPIYINSSYASLAIYRQDLTSQLPLCCYDIDVCYLFYAICERFWTFRMSYVLGNISMTRHLRVCVDHLDIISSLICILMPIYINSGYASLAMYRQDLTSQLPLCCYDIDVCCLFYAFYEWSWTFRPSYVLGTVIKRLFVFWNIQILGQTLANFLQESQLGLLGGQSILCAGHDHRLEWDASAKINKICKLKVYAFLFRQLTTCFNKGYFLQA